MTETWAGHASRSPVRQSARGGKTLPDASASSREYVLPVPAECGANMSLSAESWTAAPRGLVGAPGSSFRIVATFQGRSLSILEESFDGFAFPPTLRQLDQGPPRVLLGGLLGVNWPVDPVDSPCGPHGGDVMSQTAKSE